MVYRGKAPGRPLSPKLALGAKYVTDFVIELPQQQYILVEIEKQAHFLFTKRGRVTAKVTDAQQQVDLHSAVWWTYLCGFS